MPATVAEQLASYLTDLQNETHCDVVHWMLGSIEPMYANVRTELKWADTSLSLIVGMNVKPLFDYLNELGWRQMSIDKREEVRDQTIYMTEITYHFEKQLE